MTSLLGSSFLHSFHCCDKYLRKFIIYFICVRGVCVEGGRVCTCAIVHVGRLEGNFSGVGSRDQTQVLGLCYKCLQLLCPLDSSRKSTLTKERQHEQVKGLATKSGDLNLVSGAHMVKGESRVP